MILRISLELAIKVMGHRRKTYTKELLKALGMKGRLRPGKPPSDQGTYILRAVGPKKSMGHFVVYHEGRVYDPEAQKPMRYNDWTIWLWEGWRQTSWLAVQTACKGSS